MCLYSVCWFGRAYTLGLECQHGARSLLRLGVRVWGPLLRGEGWLETLMRLLNYLSWSLRHGHLPLRGWQWILTLRSILECWILGLGRGELGWLVHLRGHKLLILVA